MSPLKVESLTASVNSLTIGQLHKDILQEKLKEFSKFLQQRKLELEQEYNSFAQGHGISNTSKLTGVVPTSHGASPDMGQETHHHQQQELDTLRRLFQDRLDHLFHKFQREWEHNPREKAVSFPLPKAGIESTYLGEQLGDALGRGLAEICEQRPKDPIEYLALWLRKYSDNMKRKQEAAIHALKMRLEEEEDHLIKQKQGIMTRERAHIKQEEERRQKIFLREASLIEQVKDEPLMEEKQAGDDESKQETEKDCHTGGSTKRVTLVEPDNPSALYTIEEKDSVNGTGDMDGDCHEDVVQD